MAAGALKGVYGLLIVFSLTPLWNESEADKLKNANEEERKIIEANYTQKTFDQITFWLNQFYQFNTIDKSIIYLLGNKVDDEKNRIIKYKDAKKFANENNLKYYETSAKTGKNINKVFFDLVIDLLRVFPNKIEKRNVHVNKGNIRENEKSKCCLSS